MADARDQPQPGVVCDVCQREVAIVTLGCVDYCARCAPDWAGGVGGVGDEEGEAA